jgi:hypothetical protein
VDVTDVGQSLRRSEEREFMGIRKKSHQSGMSGQFWAEIVFPNDRKNSMSRD